MGLRALTGWADPDLQRSLHDWLHGQVIAPPSETATGLLCHDGEGSISDTVFISHTHVQNCQQVWMLCGMMYQE